MGGKFNGQKIGEIYKGGDARTPTASGGAAGVPNTLAHPSHNAHAADYADLGPEMAPTVYGTPTHADGAWRLHLRNQHLVDAAMEGDRQTLSGHHFDLHPDGGVIYYVPGESGPEGYTDSAHAMAIDVGAKVADRMAIAHERTMQAAQKKGYVPDEPDFGDFEWHGEDHPGDDDAAMRDYAAETTAELARHRASSLKDVRDFIRHEGGIAPHTRKAGDKTDPRRSDEYLKLPSHLKNERGLTLDQMAGMIAEKYPGLGIETENDLHDYLTSTERERKGGYTKARMSRPRLAPGSYVQWADSSGAGKGRIASVHRDEVVPNVFDGRVRGSADDPAARIRVHEKHGDGWRPTDRYVGRLFSGVYGIGALSRPSTDPDHDGDDDTPGAGGDTDHDAGASPASLSATPAAALSTDLTIDTTHPTHPGGMMRAEFSADPVGVTADGMVVLRGKAFAAGAYPDKNLTVTPEQLWDIIARFDAPVPMNLAHRHSDALAGHLGGLVDMWADDDGASLMVTSHKPAWLHALMPESRVSVEIPLDTDEPRITGCAWTSTPRVPDAQLVAAFSSFERRVEGQGGAEGAGGARTPRPPQKPRGGLLGAFAGARHDTRSGRMRLQEMHDMAVSAGAVCRAPGTASMSSAHEAKGIQAIHDVSVAHGATCDAQAITPADASRPLYGMFDQRPTSGGVSGRATTNGGSRRETRGTMNLLDWIKGKAAEDGLDVQDEDIRAQFSAGPDPKVAALDTAHKEQAALFAASEQERAAQAAEIATLKEDRAKEKRARIEAEAAHFADTQIDAKRALPAEREAAIALYVQAALDDAETQGKTAAFSDGASRVSALVGAYAARVPHQLTQEMLKDVDLQALFSQQQQAGVDDKAKVKPETRRDLLSRTAEGRAILDQEEKATRAGK